MFQATGLNVIDAKEIQRAGSRQLIQSSTDIDVMVKKREQESRAALLTLRVAKWRSKAKSRLCTRSMDRLPAVACQRLQDANISTSMLDLGLRGSRVLVTGASGGIGLETARVFLCQASNAFQMAK